jgi:hypothetical protein
MEFLVTNQKQEDFSIEDENLDPEVLASPRNISTIRKLKRKSRMITNRRPTQDEDEDEEADNEQDDDEEEGGEDSLDRLEAAKPGKNRLKRSVHRSTALHQPHQVKYSFKNNANEITPYNSKDLKI